MKTNVNFLYGATLGIILGIALTLFSPLQFNPQFHDELLAIGFERRSPTSYFRAFRTDPWGNLQQEEVKLGWYYNGLGMNGAPYKEYFSQFPHEKDLKKTNPSDVERILWRTTSD